MRELSPNEQRAIDIYNSIEDGGLKERIKMIEKLISVLYLFQSKLESKQDEVDVYDRELIIFISKMMLHLGSLISLANGVLISLKTSNTPYHIIDIPSIQVLLRTLIETHCMFYFIYRDSSNKEEVEFRYKNWKYAGILSRFKRYKEKDRKNLVDKWNADNNFLESNKSFLIQSKYFRKLSKKEKDKLLKWGDDRLGNSWFSILTKSGLNKTISGRIYHILSSMAHSTGLGMIQLNEMRLSYEEKHEAGCNYLLFSILFTCQFIIELKDHNNLFHCVFEQLEADEAYFLKFCSDIYKATADCEV